MGRSSRGTLAFYKHFLNAYPRRTGMMIGFMVIAGLAEGVGVMALIPILGFVDGQGAGEGNAVSNAIEWVLSLVGLEPTLAILLTFIVVLITVKALMLFLAQIQVGYSVAGVIRDLRIRLMQGLFGARWSFFSDRRIGQFANAVASEAQRSASAYREGAEVVASILQMLAYFVVALLISWPIALTAAIAGAGLTLIARGFIRRSRSAGQQQTDRSKSLSSRLVDVLQGIKPLKAMGRQRLVWPLLERETEAINQAQKQEISAAHALRAFHEPILTLMLAVGIYFVLGFAQQPLDETLVLAFVFYRLITHINTLQVRHQFMVVGESAFESLRDEMELAEASRESQSGTVVPGRLEREIRFENVRFGYEPGNDVLKGVNLTVPVGSFVALHGKSGSGKTTLLDLVVRLHDPREGQILVDGVPLTEIDIAAWRNQIGYVPQETLLFNASILENVTLGEPSFTRGDAERALRMAGAWEFVESRPNGLDDSIGERGGTLSGGQRQRLAIARALIGHPSLLILDEVTTALDPDTEQSICNTLKDFAGDVTILSISHQPAMRAVADVVLQMEDGRVSEISSVEV